MMKSTISITKFQFVRLMGIILFCVTIVSSQVMKVYGMVADMTFEQVDSNLEDVEEKEDVKEKESNLEDFTGSKMIDHRLTVLTKLCFHSMFVRLGSTNIEVISPPPETLI